MPKVKMHVYEMAMTFHVIFMTGQEKIWKIYKYDSIEDLIAILRRAKANLETVNIVEMALSQRRACVVELTLHQSSWSAVDLFAPKAILDRARNRIDIPDRDVRRNRCDGQPLLVIAGRRLSRRQALDRKGNPGSTIGVSEISFDECTVFEISPPPQLWRERHVMPCFREILSSTN